MPSTTKNASPPKDLLPYKMKLRAGRFVQGQTAYDPLLDLQNWSNDSKVLTPDGSTARGLTNSAMNSLRTALSYQNSPKNQFLTQVGKDRVMPLEKELFGEKYQQSMKVPQYGKEMFMRMGTPKEVVMEAMSPDERVGPMKWINRTINIGPELQQPALR